MPLPLGFWDDGARGPQLPELLQRGLDLHGWTVTSGYFIKWDIDEDRGFKPQDQKMRPIGYTHLGKLLDWLPGIGFLVQFEVLSGHPNQPNHVHQAWYRSHELEPPPGTAL